MDQNRLTIFIVNEDVILDEVVEEVLKIPVGFVNERDEGGFGGELTTEHNQEVANGDVSL